MEACSVEREQNLKVAAVVCEVVALLFLTLSSVRDLPPPRGVTDYRQAEAYYWNTNFLSAFGFFSLLGAAVLGGAFTPEPKQPDRVAHVLRSMQVGLLMLWMTILLMYLSPPGNRMWGAANGDTRFVVPMFLAIHCLALVHAHWGNRHASP